MIVLLLRLAILTLLLGVALAEIYSLAQTYLLPGWQGPLVINGLFATVAFFTVYRWDRRLEKGRLRIKGVDIPVYGPAVAVLALSLSAALISSSWSGGTTAALAPEYLFFIFLVPLMEELVFRVGISGFLRRQGSVLWGAYFSALLFAFVHTLPTAAKVLQGHVGIPLGAFFLGVICEYLYINYRRLLPVYLFHAACNATVVVFQATDARWLDWLRILYL